MESEKARNRPKGGWTAKRIDWTAVEKDFLTGGGSYRELALRHGISPDSVKKRAAADRWQEKRRLLKQSREEKAQEPSGSELRQRRDRQELLRDAADEALLKLRQAVEELEPGNAPGLASLVRALKDLRELQGLKKDELDLEEQQARIERIRSQIRRADEGESAGGVVLLPVPETVDREEDEA